MWWQLVLATSFCGIQVLKGFSLNLNAEGPSKKLTRFWTSTGFCPLDPKEQNLLSYETQLNLALMGSLPNQGLTHIRIHYLLNLLQVQTNLNEIKWINFTKLDQVLDWMHSYNLKPNFELMGLPQNLQPNNSLVKTPKFWQELIKTTTLHYLNRYSFKTLRKWRFESWNEPDLKNSNLLNFTSQQFENYVTSCKKGLQQAFGNYKNIKFGGPAGLFKSQHHPLCWGILRKCPQDCPFNFISFHRKGNASSDSVVEGTLSLVEELSKRFKGIFNATSVANTEADPLKTWSEPQDFRADLRYSIMVLQTISKLYEELVLTRGVNIEVLSNDNGFLNFNPYYFRQRTLFARFQMNKTTPASIQFIRKPVYITMGLLSYMSDEYLRVVSEKHHPKLTVLATRGGHPKTISILLCYGNNTPAPKTTPVNLTIRQLKGSFSRCSALYVIYTQNNTHTNPYFLWQHQQKSTVFPDKKQREILRKSEGPIRLNHPISLDHSNKLLLKLPLAQPSIFLIHLACKPQKAPPKVTSLRALNISYNEVLLTWSFNYQAKTLLTFKIEHISGCQATSSFHRINAPDTIFHSFHYAPKDLDGCEATKGRYRVQAIDYWQRHGQFSHEIRF